MDSDLVSSPTKTDDFTALLPKILNAFVALLGVFNDVL